jgi:hypothetical protein
VNEPFARWRLDRAGIISLADYANERFVFEDGAHPERPERLRRVARCAGATSRGRARTAGRRPSREREDGHLPARGTLRQGESCERLGTLARYPGISSPVSVQQSAPYGFRGALVASHVPLARASPPVPATTRRVKRTRPSVIGEQLGLVAVPPVRTRARAPETASRRSWSARMRSDTFAGDGIALRRFARKVEHGEATREIGSTSKSERLTRAPLLVWRPVVAGAA